MNQLQLFIYAAGPESQIDIFGHQANVALLPIHGKSIVSDLLDQYAQFQNIVLILDQASSHVLDFCQLVHPELFFKSITPQQFQRIEVNLSEKDIVLRPAKSMNSEKFEKLNTDCPNYIFMKGGSFFYHEGDKIIKYFEDPFVSAQRTKRIQFLNQCGPTDYFHKGHFFGYRYVEGNTFDQNLTERKFDFLLNYLKKNFWINSIDISDSYLRKTQNFYREKSRERFQLFSKKFRKYFNFTDLNEDLDVEKLMEKIPWDFLERPVINSFHGDLLLNNIIQHPGGDGITLIDWRQEFAGDLEYGDVRYDFAKLLLNLEIDFLRIKNGEFSVNLDVKEYFLPVLQPQLSKRLFDCANEFGISSEDIKLIKNLILLNIAPLHRKDLAVAFWWKGLRELI